MKYKVKKTDIFLNGQVIAEGSIIDSKKYSEEDIESVKHLLEEVEKSTPIQSALNTETKTDSTTTNVPEPVKPKRTNTKKTINKVST